MAASTNRQALAIDAGAVEQPPADRRLEPIPGWNPTHATIRLLRKVALGEWDQGDLISDQRGLVIINNLDGPLAGKRYCGAGLSEGSRQAMAAFQDLLDRLDLDGVESVRCSNEPRPPSCITTELGHQGAIYFRFADGERGIELAAIYRLALSALSDLPDDRVVAHEKAVVAAADEEMRRLSAQPCSAAK